MLKETNEMSPRGFLRELKKSIGIINTSENIAGTWLSENKLKLIYIGRDVEKSIAKVKRLPSEQNSLRIYSVCENYLSNLTGEITESDLISELNRCQSSGSYLTILELYHLRDFLSASLLISVSHDVLSETPDNEAIGNNIKHLYELSDIDFSNVTSQVSYSESVLISDPAGIYVMCDEETKTLYRHCLYKIARRDRMSEYNAALMIKERAENSSGDERHVGYHLLAMTKARAPWVWFSLLTVVPIITTALLVLISLKASNVPAFFASLLSFFPVRKLTSHIASDIIKSFMSPSILPRVKIDEIPDEGRTLVTFTTVLTGGKGDTELFDKLETYALAYGSPNLSFSVLADLPDSQSEYDNVDDDIIDYAKSRIDKINAKGGKALLFLRDREFSKTERKYIGRERKRGAQSELFSLLIGRETSLKIYGSAVLYGVNYVLALDSDTEILSDDIKRLIGTALHPNSKPIISSENGYPTVISGYGVIQPKVSVSLEKIDDFDKYTLYKYANCGAGSYATAEFSVYSSLFDTGIFCGKGLISVEAYTRCVLGAFPREQILSHDIAEGLRMRCGFASDTEIYDSVPSCYLSERKRAHRWMRGDMQSLILTKRHIRDEDGRKYRNPLSARSKMILSEPLYGMLTSVLRVPAIILSLYAGGAVGLLIFLILFSDGLYLTGKRIIGTYDVPPRKYLSMLPGYYKSSMFDTLFPCISAADICTLAFDAMYRSFFRMKVSKRHLLEWTTAACADRGELRGGYISYGKKLLPPFFIGVISVLISLISHGVCAFLLAAAGVIWSCFPIVIYRLSDITDKKAERLSLDDCERIKNDARLMWDYFSENVNDLCNGLPPDNVSYMPLCSVAERTSPTNIGMYMLSILNAYDFGFITKSELQSRLEKTLDTVESLEKYHGHLYNWYDIKTLRVLYPSYVSTVDSGNFVCSLVTLKNGIGELGASFAALSDRMAKIINSTDFSVLYSRKRGLYHIGYNGVTGELDRNVYDLYSSEMLTTSFYSVAAGYVPSSHLSCLGRLYDDSYSVSLLLSWSGSAFEYFMPCIFLPFARRTERGESLLSAYEIQRESGSTFENHAIYGMSESGFYNFDSEMNYAYKAFGCRELAMSPNVIGERVFAPYSLYLMTAVCSNTEKCLDGLRKTSLYGRYGFYEALDMTPKRVGDGYGIVRQYMSHHIGMSITSAANAVFDNINVKRFMSEPVCGAAAPLLYRKAETAKKRLTRELIDAKTKPLVYPDGDLSVKTDFAIISNGRIKAAASKDGKITLSDGETLITSPMSRGCGQINLLLKAGDEIYNLLSDSEGSAKMKRSFIYDGASLHFESESFIGDEYFSSDVCILCDSDSPTLRLSVAFHGTQPQGELLFILSPVLNTERAYFSSPAYSDIFFSAQRLGNRIVYKKSTPEGKEKIMYFSVRGKSDEDYQYLLRADEILPFAFSEHDIYKIFNTVESSRDPIPARFVPLIHPIFCVKARAAASHEIIITADNDASTYDVADALIKAKNASKLQRALSGADEAAVRHAFEIAECVFDRDPKITEFAGIDEVTSSRDLFWRYGISGDLPIYTLFAKRVVKEGLPNTVLSELIHAKRFLFLLGVRFDFVIVADDASYLSSDAEAIRDEIKENGCENLLGHSGGIFIVDSGTLSVSDEAAFIARSCGYEDLKGSTHPFDIITPKPAHEARLQRKISDKTAEIEVANDAVLIKNGIYTSPMTMMYANRVFGTLLTNKTLGFSWYFNSSEMRVTSRHIDPILGAAGEYITLTVNGESYDAAMNAESATFELGCAVYKGTVGDTEYRLSVGVSDKLPCKLYALEFSGVAEIKAELRIYPPAATVISNGKATILSSAPISILPLSVSDGVSGRFASYGSYLSIEAMPYHSRCGFALSALTGKDKDKCFDKVKRSFVSYNDIILSLRAYEKRLGQIILSGYTKYQEETIGQTFDFAAYQAIIYRIMGRCGYSQAGGAYGYRDQLQDSLSAIWFCPKITREIIYRSCKNQYDDGTARHWYHPYGAGLKTKCSDDYMWLPFVTAEYILMTGEYDILDTEIPFCTSPELSPHEADRYEIPRVTDSKYSVYEHCMRAIEHSYRRGEHGLPLIGTGDWNDGENKIGARGRGESVWLAFFFMLVYRKFADALEYSGYDTEICRKLKSEAEKLSFAAESAWDGEWYIRAYDDDGEPVGSHNSVECAIDLLPQAFSVFANGSNERTKTAMRSALRELYDEKYGIMRLFAPPFDNVKKYGYISSYPPGIRENGGQYTHAAVWSAIALFKLGKFDDGERVLRSLTPLFIYKRGRMDGKFTSEPYLLCADVAFGNDVTGKSGWSGYTGSASWWYIAVMKYVFGAELSLGILKVTPPERSPDEYSFAVRIGEDIINVTVSSRISNDGDSSEYDRVYHAMRGETILVPSKKNVRKVLIKIKK